MPESRRCYYDMAEKLLKALAQVQRTEPAEDEYEGEESGAAVTQWRGLVSLAEIWSTFS
jgi:hypothetical protein